MNGYTLKIGILLVLVNIGANFMHTVWGALLFGASTSILAIECLAQKKVADGIVEKNEQLIELTKQHSKEVINDCTSYGLDMLKEMSEMSLKVVEWEALHSAGKAPCGVCEYVLGEGRKC